MQQSTPSKNPLTFKATVIGSGPAGIAIMGELISKKLFPILWIDPNFNGGKLANYREVPANTKAAYFLEYMKVIPAFQEILDNKSLENNPSKIFEDLDLNIPPSLSKAYEMCNSLISNIRNLYKDKVIFHKGLAGNLLFHEKEKIWEIFASESQNFLSQRIILAIGSKPRKYKGPGDTLPQIPLEILVNDNKDNLSKYVNSSDSIAVIGSSHSSILALKHLENLPEEKRPKKIHCFFREKIKYAIHTDKGIIYDNIGLKGQAANWSKEHLEAGFSEIIKMHYMDNSKVEQITYEKFLPECTKIAALIGFERNQITMKILDKKGRIRDVSDFEHNGTNLKLMEKVQKNSNTENERKFMENIWGIGIAYPRHVKDLSGVYGYDVGVKKFGKAAKVIERQIDTKLPLPKF